MLRWSSIIQRLIIFEDFCKGDFFFNELSLHCIISPLNHEAAAFNDVKSCKKYLIEFCWSPQKKSHSWRLKIDSIVSFIHKAHCSVDIWCRNWIFEAQECLRTIKAWHSCLLASFFCVKEDTTDYWFILTFQVQRLVISWLKSFNLFHFLLIMNANMKQARKSIFPLPFITQPTWNTEKELTLFLFAHTYNICLCQNISLL